jgi:hypothetical protein
MIPALSLLRTRKCGMSTYAAALVVGLARRGHRTAYAAVRFRFFVSEARVTVGLADVRVSEAARAAKRSRMPYLLSLTDITSSRPRCGLAKRLLKCDLQ